MNFSISVEKFQDVVKKMGYILQVNADDVTSMMMIEASEGTVKFSGTGGAVHSSIYARDCEVSEKGKVLIQLRDINMYVQKFLPLADGYGTENFTVITDGSEGKLKTKTIFSSGKPSYRTLKFKLYSTELLPPIKEFEDAQLIVNSDILIAGINKILHCVDPGEIREALAGMYLSINDGNIIFAGTNGIKLSETTMPINADIKQVICVLKYSTAMAMKLMLDSNSQVFIRFEDRNMYIRCNDVYLNGRLVINEPYPEYKLMLYSQNKVITIPRYDLIDSVSAASSVLDKEDNSRLTMQFSGNTLILKNDKIEATHEFDYDFEYELDMDINGSFLLQMLLDFVGDQLEICFTDNNSPVIFRIKDNPSHISLLMSLRRR